MSILMIICFFIFAQDFENSYQEYCSKMINDVFLRGVIADNLIEDEDIVNKIGCSSTNFVDKKRCIVLWIERNPEDACIFFGKRAKHYGNWKIKWDSYEYELTPEFREYLDELVLVSRGVRDERMRDVSSFLFDTSREDEKKQIEFMSLKSKTPSNVTQRSFDFSDYYLLNANAISNEILSIEKVASKLSSYSVEDFDGIIERCDNIYKDFLSYISGIKGIKGLSNKQLEKLLDIIERTKRSVILKSIVVKLRLVEGVVKESFDDDILKSFNETVEEFRIFSSKTISYDSFLEAVKRLWQKLDFIEKRAVFILESKRIANKLVFTHSCFFDYMVYLISHRFYSLNFYSDVERSLFTLREYFSKADIKNPKFLRDYIKKRQEALSIIQKLDEVKKRHRLFQYIFFDNIIPFDIYRDKSRIYLGIKIKEEMLF